MIFVKGFVILIVLNIVLIKEVNGTVHNLDLEARHPPFEPRIYEDALDPELCSNQLTYLTTTDTLLMVTCKYSKLSNDNPGFPV